MLLFLFLLLAGCESLAPTIGSETPAPAQPTATLAATLPQATFTTAPTALPTPLQETVETPSPPTAGGAATTAPTQASGPTPTHPIADIYGLSGFAADVNPLTGLVAANPADLQRRPLAVKISNYPPLVRPQAGLNNADLLFEHYAEGGVTRFTAVFYSRAASPIGSIRSGRLIDLEIPRMYDAAFAYSGSSGPVQEMIRTSDFFARVISPDFGHGGFYRVEGSNRPFEHTLFTGTDLLWAQLDNRDENRAPSLPIFMSFSQTPPAGTAVNSLEVRYRATNAFWQYNGATGRYSRWSDGAVHTDANSGVQLNFRNLIVLAAHHEDTTILEDFVNGGNYSIQIQIWGEGPVSIFRDGVRIDGRWRRDDPAHMLTFYDLEGRALPLSPGNSFFQIVPLGFDGLVTN